MRFGISFLDVDECSASVPVCDVNADCNNSRGSYRCSCKAGFTGDGKNVHRLESNRIIKYPFLFSCNGIIFQN